MSYQEIEELVGRTLVAATGKKGDEEMLLTDKDGRWVRLYHEQDCCENVAIEDVAGDLADLLGAPLLRAEVVSSDGAPEPEAGVHGYDADAHSYTWTFYKLETIKGSVTVRWLGTSNGHYSEKVSIVTSESP